mgnify:FL=1
MATVGKNILDNLTTGMYSDSKVIFREYIQNACDQIDKAIKQNLLAENEGLVDIYIDSSKRYISIRDNATGVQSNSFIADLGDIANSNKLRGENKGFRGIGRLCGLAYCKTLKFSTSFFGEPKKSIMICDAQTMREMLAEEKKYTLDEIWDTIVSFQTADEQKDEHYFEVELIDINKANTDLLNVDKVKEYLHFVAPVPYKNTFILRSEIYNHAKQIGYKIDEYCIKVNGMQLFKEYTTRLKEANGTNIKNYDEISKLEFHDFYSQEGELLAWMWIGLSRFEKQIPKFNKMRGLRLRSANIQIGGDDSLKGLFKEDRGNYYFVGEVFAASKKLIPNSQRNYFNENETRVEFEDMLRVYFFDILHKLYTDANKMKNAYKRQETHVAAVEEFNKKIQEHGFVDDAERQKMEYQIDKARTEAEDARKQIEKYKKTQSDSPLAEVHRSIERKYDSGELVNKASVTSIMDHSTDKKEVFITSGMSKLSKKERKLVARLLSIITDNAPKEIAEIIIAKIKEDLK